MQVEDRNQQANLLRTANRVTQVEALAGRVGRLPVVVRQRESRGKSLADGTAEFGE
jgi:hypothetical protein